MYCDNSHHLLKYLWYLFVLYVDFRQISQICSKLVTFLFFAATFVAIETVKDISIVDFYTWVMYNKL